jgi:hypothetical protein
MPTKIDFPANCVGLIVRGKRNDDHFPALTEQHADCILPDGGPVGYFGNEGDGSCGEFPSGRGWSASWNRSGMNMNGFVAYYHDFQHYRPQYVNIDLAKKFNLVSTVLIAQVTREQAKAFAQAWATMKLDPGTFNFLGRNCSTRASGAFMEASIVSQRIPGLDTPNNLYLQLTKNQRATIRTYSGYVGFRPNGSGGYQVLLEPAK